MRNFLIKILTAAYGKIIPVKQQINCVYNMHVLGDTVVMFPLFNKPFTFFTHYIKHGQKNVSTFVSQQKDVKHK